MEDQSLMAEMDRLRQALREAKNAGMLDYQALSQSIGRNPTYIQQFVTKKSPRILHAHLAEAVRGHLESLQRSGPPHRSVRSERKAKGKEEIVSLLRQIDGLPDAALEPVYGVIAGFLDQAHGSQKQTPAHGQSEPSTPRRAKAPS